MQSWPRLLFDFDDTKSSDAVFTSSSHLSFLIQVINFPFRGWANIECLQLPLFVGFTRANHDKDLRHPIKRACTESLYWTALSYVFLCTLLVNYKRKIFDLVLLCFFGVTRLSNKLGHLTPELMMNPWMWIGCCLGSYAGCRSKLAILSGDKLSLTSCRRGQWYDIWILSRGWLWIWGSWVENPCEVRS